MIKVNGKVVEFNSFGNGETELMHKSLSGIDFSKLLNVHFKYEEDADLLKLMFVKDYLDSMTDSPKHLVIYYMPYSRMDRSENGSAFTLKYVSRFINRLGFNMGAVIEPHSDVTPALLDNFQSLYVNFHLIHEVKEQIGFDDEHDFLVYPDAGAAKRYSKMDALNVLTASKVRNFETHRITKMTIENTDKQTVGRKAIIVDDLSSYGGTFKMCGDALREAGFSEVYLLVAHAEKTIMEGELLKEESPITKVFTTSTIIDQMSVLMKEAQLENEITHKIKIYDIEGVLTHDYI